MSKPYDDGMPKMQLMTRRSFASEAEAKQYAASVHAHFQAFVVRRLA